jgi:hypothetical protein
MQTLIEIVEFSGMAICWIGLYGRFEMGFRVLGKRDYYQVVRGLTVKYQRLISEGNAPQWPLTLSRWCFPLGIAVCFSPVLWFKACS